MLIIIFKAKVSLSIPSSKTQFRKWYFSFITNDRVSGFWASLFVLSKVPELGDTFFILLRKQPLIFLHWWVHPDWNWFILLKWMRSYSHLDLPNVINWQNALFWRFSRLFSESYTGVPAMLPCASLPRLTWGTLRKQLTTHSATVQGILSRSINKWMISMMQYAFHSIHVVSFGQD